MKIFINKTDPTYFIIRITDDGEKPLKKFSIVFEDGVPTRFNEYRRVTPESSAVPIPIGNDSITSHLLNIIAFSEGKADIEGASNVPEYEPLTPSWNESLIITDITFDLQLI